MNEEDKSELVRAFEAKELTLREILEEAFYVGVNEAQYYGVRVEHRETNERPLK